MTNRLAITLALISVLAFSVFCWWQDRHYLEPDIRDMKGACRFQASNTGDRQ